MNMNPEQQQILDYLGVVLTVDEVMNLIADLEAKLEKQAPYFDARALKKLDLFKRSIDPEFAL